MLANGNRLITESQAGRVFEVSPDGEVVWEYIKPYDEHDAALIEKAYPLPRGYFEVTTRAVLDGLRMRTRIEFAAKCSLCRLVELAPNGEPRRRMR